MNISLNGVQHLLSASDQRQQTLDESLIWMLFYLLHLSESTSLISKRIKCWMKKCARNGFWSDPKALEIFTDRTIVRLNPHSIAAIQTCALTRPKSDTCPDFCATKTISRLSTFGLEWYCVRSICVWSEVICIWHLDLRYRLRDLDDIFQRNCIAYRNPNCDMTFRRVGNSYCT